MKDEQVSLMGCIDLAFNGFVLILSLLLNIILIWLYLQLENRYQEQRRQLQGYDTKNFEEYRRLVP